ncbi:MFS transporter [Kineosporia babensis]|uniref:MFS transporter n=1 Tax=Kineosporia babensis TaxID=499548 RepID=A0A9X1NA51_9ACTN|nr:MFS transporter [Kineosporia babensis]
MHNTESPPRAQPRDWTVLAILTLAVLILAIDGTVLALAVPSLVADLQPSANQILWIADIYAFALAGLLITMGNLADRIGRKRILLLGSAGFAAASLLAAFAPSAEWLIAARALLGVSGATIMPSTLSLIRNHFLDPGQRAKAIAIWTAGMTGGAAIGPLVGGALIQAYWWGAVFLINVPVVAVVLLLGIPLLKESRNPERPSVDWVSSVLLILTLVPLVYAIKHTISSGFDGQSLATLIIGLSAGTLFVRRQGRLDQPLIDLQLFRNPVFSGAVAASTIAVFALIGVVFFFSQYLQFVHGYTPVQAGAAEIPLTIASIAVIAVISSLQRLGTGPALALGLGVAGIGFGTLAFTRDIEGYLPIAVSLVVLGLGLGIAQTLATDAVMTAAPKERAGAAASISETAYELGGALGIAILGTLTTLIYRTQLQIPTETPSDAADAAQESIAGAVANSDNTALLDAGRDAFLNAVQATSYIAGALMLVAAVIAWRLIPKQRNPEETPSDANEAHHPQGQGANPAGHP